MRLKPVVMSLFLRPVEQLTAPLGDAGALLGVYVVTAALSNVIAPAGNA
jgi:hypothetical protein